MIYISFELAVALVIIVIILILLVAVFSSRTDDGYRSGTPYAEMQIRRAGEEGEIIAREVIGRVLRPGDTVISNVNLELSEDKTAEIDDVIINHRGVFIIEVKNYVGTLRGTADDSMWDKIKRDDWGELHRKQVRNPLTQIGWQTYVLKEVLQSYGINVWVESYVYLVNHNSPVHNEKVLETEADIDRVIHKGRNNNLTEKDTGFIVRLLKNE